MINRPTSTNSTRLLQHGWLSVSIAPRAAAQHNGGAVRGNGTLPSFAENEERGRSARRAEAAGLEQFGEFNW